MPSRNKRMNFPDIQDPVIDKPKKYILYCLTWPKLTASISFEQEEMGRAKKPQNKNHFVENSFIHVIQTDNVSSYKVHLKIQNISNLIPHPNICDN